MTDSKFEVIHVVLYCLSHMGNASFLSQKWALGPTLGIGRDQLFPGCGHGLVIFLAQTALDRALQQKI
jgi:hypothetical protein